MTEAAPVIIAVIGWAAVAWLSWEVTNARAAKLEAEIRLWYVVRDQRRMARKLKKLREDKPSGGFKLP